MTGFLIFDVDVDTLEVLCAVHAGDWQVRGFDPQLVSHAVDRGLLDRVAGTAGGVALTTPGRHTLWKYDRPTVLEDEPWQRCQACGSTDMTTVSAWCPSAAPVRADCRLCGVKWTEAEHGRT